MTNDVSNIRIGLTVAFAIAILAIIAELCYVLWRRRRFRRQNLSGESDINTTTTTSSNSNSIVPSKELLYFFCWKSQLSRIEPADGGGARPVFHSATTYHDDPHEPIDLLKLQEMYGPSRVLFTIKEEEKEEETEQHHHYFSDDQKLSSTEQQEKKRVCLKNWFEDAKTETEGEEEESPVMVVVNIDEIDLELETPFSTPCASPPYYTPIPSPSPSPSRHDDHASVVEEEQVQTTDRNLTHTVTIEADV